MNDCFEVPLARHARIVAALCFLSLSTPAALQAQADCSSTSPQFSPSAQRGALAAIIKSVR
jgi:hypothetical protein